MKSLYNEDKFYLTGAVGLFIWEVLLAIPGIAEKFKYQDSDMFVNSFFIHVIIVIVMLAITTKYKKSYTLIAILIASVLDMFLPAGLFIPHILVLIVHYWYFKYVINYYKGNIVEEEDDE